jgi:hypothetical protein
MSVRPNLYAITDIEPIRQALGSRDVSLVDRIKEAYIRVEEERYHADDELVEEALAQDEFADEFEPWEVDKEELREIRKLAKAFVNGKFTRNQEPGIWREVIVYLAHALGLMPSSEPLFGEWKTSAWRLYLDRISERLPDGPRQSLKHLVNGRSLTGRQIEEDGCSYAWLTASEISDLLGSLREIPVSLLAEPAPPTLSPVDLLAAFEGRPEHGSAASDSGWLSKFHDELLKCLSACEGQCVFLAG